MILIVSVPNLGRFLPFEVVTSIQRRFGKRIRQLRLERGWTQQELGARAAKHWTYIGGIERGHRNPTLTVIAAIASAFGMSIAELFGEGTASRDDATRT